MVRGIELSRFRICYHPDAEDPAAEFDAVCRLVMLARNTVFAVDEIWLYCGSAWLPHPLRRIAFTGRHTGTSLVFMAQRAAAVSKSLISIATSLILFRMEALDVRAIARHVNLPEDVQLRLPSLPDRVYFLRDERLQWRLNR
jgi:hypothetical protein